MTDNQITPEMIDQMTAAADTINNHQVNKSKLQQQMDEAGMQGPAVPPQQAPIMTAPEAANPLQQYFRTPGLHITLPSKGIYNPGEIEFTPNGEVAVYSMTAKDEIVMKSPDALLNGHAVVQVINSCAPGIKNPRGMPSPDIDALLIAIRASTYGNSMDIDVDCPKCKKENTYAVDLRRLLESMTHLQEGIQMEVAPGMFVNAKPFTFQSSVNLALIAFEESRLLQSMAKEKNLESTQLDFFGKTYNRVADLNNDMIAESIINIVTPDGKTVTNKEFISDWVKNAPTQQTKTVKNTLDEQNERGLQRKLEVTCANEECRHTWETSLNYDPSSFFGQDS